MTEAPETTPADSGPQDAGLHSTGPGGDDLDSRRRALRRHRAAATGLLVAMGAVYSATQVIHTGSPWQGLVEAGTEAALIGGLADWFAVTALFRRPLGLPIPHTALVPRNKDRIGRRIGAFVTDNFLAPAVVHERFRAFDLTTRAGDWLSHRENAERAAAYLAEMVPPLLRAFEDDAVRDLMRRALTERLEAIDPGPLLDRLLVAVPREDYDALVATAVTAARDALARNEADIQARISARNAWWIPRTIDRRIGKAIIDGVDEVLAQMADPGHDTRRQLDAALIRLRESLTHGPEAKVRLAMVRDRLLGEPRVQRRLRGLWDEVRDMIIEAANHRDGTLRHAIADGLQTLGRRLTEDPALRAHVDDRLEAVFTTLVVPWRREIGALIEDVVARWDPETVSERVELMVGKDLQYIRVNGTVVGAIVGCLLWAGVTAARGLPPF